VIALYVIGGFGLAGLAAAPIIAAVNHYRAKGDWRRGLPDVTDAELDPTADIDMARRVPEADRTEKQRALVTAADAQTEED
jgi:hypothetical protein